MNVASMQNLSKPKGAANAVGNGDAGATLGQQALITPEMLAANPELAKMMEGNPQGLDFKAMLGQTQVNADGIPEGKISDVLAGLKKASAETSEVIADNGDKSILIDPTKNSKEANQKVQAEEVTKQFMPERKSIFDVASNKKAPTNQLQNLSEFVANQSPTKKMAMKNAYKNKMDKSLFAKKIDAQVPQLGGVDAAESQVKITDLMLNAEGADDGSQMMNQGKQNNSLNQATATAQSAKVFDLSQLATNKTDVIGQIQDYIIQSKASSEPTMNMSFEHKDLGLIDLQVSKADNNQLNIMINSRTQEGAKFFTQNQAELLQTLSQAGVQVADLKLDSSSNSNLNQNGNNDSSFANKEGQGQGQPKDQKDADSKRREELWKLFEGQEAA